MPKILSNLNIQTSQQGILVSQSEIEMLDGVTSPIQTQLNNKIDNSQKGVAGGVAPLDSNGKVPSTHLTLFTDYINTQVDTSGILSYNPTNRVFSSSTSINWTNVSSKPSTYPPATHTHSSLEITGLTTGGEVVYNLTQSSNTFTEEADDFLGSSSINKLGWTTASNNGWIGAEQANRFPGTKGVQVLGIYGTNQTTSNYTHLRLGDNNIRPLASEGISNIELEARVGLSNHMQTRIDYTSRFGLLDTGSGNGITSSILIAAEYNSDAYNWIAIYRTGTGSAVTQVITPVTGSLATTVFNLRIFINCETYSITFQVDTVSITVNIPSNLWLFAHMSPTFVISRRAVSEETLNRTLWVDRFIMRYNVAPSSTSNFLEDIQNEVNSKIPLAEKGEPNGVVPLDSNNLIPSIHIPTYQQSVGFGGNVVIYGVEPPVELSIPVPISQGGTGTTTAPQALATLGAQPQHPKLTSLGQVIGSGIITHSGLTNGFFTRTLAVGSPLTITNADGLNNNPTIELDMGSGSTLDADLLDGLHSSSFLRKDTSDTLSGNLIITGSLTTNGVNTTTPNRPGPTRLFRRENDSPYSIQTHWTGSHWYLKGYGDGTAGGIDTFHGECRVGLADLATNASAVNGVTNIEPLAKSYGSIRITGATNGHSGIYFPTIDRTFMSSGAIAGMYQEGIGWDFYVNSAATTTLLLSRSAATTSGNLHVNYGADTNRFQFRGDGNAWNAVNGWTPNWSDENLKRDIEPLTNCLDIVNQLNPVSYRWNTTAMLSEVIGSIEDNSTHYGLIAQQIEPLIKDIVKQGPEAVDGSETYLTYEKTEIIPFLIGAIKELYLLVMTK